MRNSRWMLAVLLGVVCVTATVGCKSRKAGKGAGGPGDVGAVPVGGVESLPGSDLAPRPGDEMNIVSNQFTPVYFDYDSAQIRGDQRPALDAIATYLNENKSAQLIVDGHCDERGSAEYNMALGERRALAARAYLVGLGVDGTRVQTKSYGVERPADPGHTEDAWAKNRRDEFSTFAQ